MPRECVVVQVGQCGNQIGFQFWQDVLQEHVARSKENTVDRALSSFFSVAERHKCHCSRRSSLQSTQLTARAVLLDMEEGVINRLMRSSYAYLFNPKSTVTDVSGSGNNWAIGSQIYGPKHHDALLDVFRHQAEDCESLQSFFLINSIGGGTGSGLGSYALRLLADEYPEVFRFSVSVFPAENDDVITSPYNSALTMNALSDDASCVFPVSNDALSSMCRKTQHDVVPILRGPEAFCEMNSIVARLITNITSSSRFEGTLSMDLNEVATNLVPFPSVHLISSSMNDVLPPRKGVNMNPTLRQIFTDAVLPEYQLVPIVPTRSLCLASTVLIRGDKSITEITKNMPLISRRLRSAPYCRNACKLALCQRPPLNSTCSLLCLLNSCEMGLVIDGIRRRFVKLLRQRAHKHHYTAVMDPTDLDDTASNLQALVQTYSNLERNSNLSAEMHASPWDELQPLI